MERIKNAIRQLLAKAGVAGGIDFSVPPDPAMGDLAFACFSIAKEWKMPPPEAAKKIAQKLSAPDSRILERVDAVGPYVNFHVKAEALAGLVLEEISRRGKNFGHNKYGKKAAVVFEYPSNNTHKELHIGHLRNICLGNALVQIFAANGYKPVAVNYINDFGLHVAKCLWGLMKFHKDEKPPADKQKWLGEIYAEASRYLAEHPEFEQEVRDLQVKIENKDADITTLLKTTRQWSLAGFARIYKELKVRHRYVFFESRLKDKGQRMVDRLLRKGVAEKGERGAVIVDLRQYGLDVALLRKSDGAGVYMTSDLALAVEKQKKYPRAKAHVSITSNEQDFYFRQLFKILELAGLHMPVRHISYGLVNLPSGKMSSRKGNVILYEQVRDAVFEKIYAETKDRHPDWRENKVRKTARILSFAAIKFDFLKHEANKVIYFDEESATSFDGFTGPYILYAVARINSILKKAGARNKMPRPDLRLLNSNEEKQLVFRLAGYPEAVQKAMAEYNPSVITKYCFDLAKQFSDFYSRHSVLNPEEKKLVAPRVFLARLTKDVLADALALLTIDILPEM